LTKTEANATEALADFDQIFSAPHGPTSFTRIYNGKCKTEMPRTCSARHLPACCGQQFYYFDIPQWLNGDPGQPPPPARCKRGATANGRISATLKLFRCRTNGVSVVRRGLAFHCIPLARADADFAKEQLVLLTREWYMHPNGQLPAYEWAFGDVNPPVHAWAWRVFQIDRKLNDGKGDLVFSAFFKAFAQFHLWVNRKDDTA
jgi:hypothetical protein